MDGPSTSKNTSNTNSNDKELDLSRDEKEFQGHTKRPDILTTVRVRRRRRGLRHVAEDLLFTLTFSESDMGALPIVNVLMGVHQSVLVLVQKLKAYFNDKQRRLCFFSADMADMNQMTSPIFSGGRDLWNESERKIVSSILTPLLAFLCSNREIDLRAGLEVKCCVTSIAHTLEYDERQANRRVTKRPPPDDHLVGHRGSSLKSIDHYSGRHHGLILVPRGIPQDLSLFDGRCMPVAFCIGKMIFEAAMQGEKTVKKLLHELRGLSQRAKASQKQKNATGQKIWTETRKLLCTSPNGPYSYSCLDDLSRKFNCQVVVFSNLLAQPIYTFPSDSMQTHPECPCIFLQEISTLDPQVKTQ